MNIRKLIVYALVGCGLYGTAAAQGKSVLEQLCARMSDEAAVLDYSYSLDMSGMKTTGSGTLTVQGQSYVMKGNGISIYCNASALWVVDDAGKDVLVDNVAQEMDAALSNPVLLLANLSSVFSIDSPSRNGSSLIYALSPKTDCGIVSGEVSIDTSGASPVFSSGWFKTSDGALLDIKIKSMTFVPKKPLTFYTLDISGLDSSWMITDLR